MKSNNPVQQSEKTAGLVYLLIIVTSILSMIFGPYKLMVALTGIPAIVFEITIGIWLLVKGIDLKYINSLTKKE
jgi:hypothetical protein